MPYYFFKKRKKRRDSVRICYQKRTLKDGEKMVFLKVIPKRSNLTLGKDRSLSPHFAGPFKILKRVGTLAYQLELLENIVY